MGEGYLTPDVGGLGGRIKERPEDFLVEEIPAYAPSGEGEHIYLLVEKRGLTTREMVRRVARHFGVRERDVGVAGQKDKAAITRQVVSVHTPGKGPEDFPSIKDEKLAVLWTDRHGNKLRTGHLKGNRFSIRIRGVEFTGARGAMRVLAALAKSGVPNRFGPQRFGSLKNNHLVGGAMVAGDWEGAARELVGPNAAHPDQQPEARALFEQGRYQEAMEKFSWMFGAERAVLGALARGASPERAMMAMDTFTARFMVSALQSAVFNRVLDERLKAGTLGVLMDGDVACKLDNRALFDVDRAVVEDPSTGERLAKFEISPSGPIWGASMKRAQGAVAEAEEAALAAIGLTPEQIEAFDRAHPSIAEGDRRPLRVPIIDPDCEGGADEHGSYVRVAFELPKGSYATAVLREIMKPADDAAVDTEVEA